MIDQTLTGPVVSFAGSFGGGFMMGYGLKKVIRIVIIILGAIGGIFFIALALMQKQGYVSQIIWDKMASDIYIHANTLTGHMGHDFGIQHVVGYLGLPITGGLGLGLISGFLRG